LVGCVSGESMEEAIGEDFAANIISQNKLLLADDRGLCYAASRRQTHFTDLMPYFFLSLTLPDGNVNPQIWEITDTVAYRVGVTNFRI